MKEREIILVCMRDKNENNIVPYCPLNVDNSFAL